MGIIAELAARIARGELESQAAQTCRHERVSSCGGGLSGFCFDCGEDTMALEVEEYLRTRRGDNSNG
jgi:hypothetical protein